MADLHELLPGLWRASSEHPEWTEDEGGEDGWDPVVSWWAISTSRGLLLVDPLVADWDAVDRLVSAHGGCAGVVRTIHWHERDVAVAAERYGAELWAAAPPGETAERAVDHALENGVELWDGITAFRIGRDDEIALWLPSPGAVLFADVMLRRADGTLRVCPDSWMQTDGDPARTRTVIARLLDELAVVHALVSHGPQATGDGRDAMRAALTR